MYWKAKVRYRGPIIFIVFNDYVDDVLDPISLIKSFEFVNIMDGSSHSFVCLTFSGFVSCPHLRSKLFAFRLILFIIFLVAE